MRQLLSAILTEPAAMAFDEEALVSKESAEETEEKSTVPFSTSPTSTNLQWIHLVKDRHDRLKQFF